jgi:hypothetical protein
VRRPHKRVCTVPRVLPLSMQRSSPTCALHGGSTILLRGRLPRCPRCIIIRCCSSSRFTALGTAGSARAGYRLWCCRGRRVRRVLALATTVHNCSTGMLQSSGYGDHPHRHRWYHRHTRCVRVTVRGAPPMGLGGVGTCTGH